MPFGGLRCRWIAHGEAPALGLAQAWLRLPLLHLLLLAATIPVRREQRRHHLLHLHHRPHLHLARALRRDRRGVSHLRHPTRVHREALTLAVMIVAPARHLLLASPPVLLQGSARAPLVRHLVHRALPLHLALLGAVHRVIEALALALDLRPMICTRRRRAGAVPTGTPNRRQRLDLAPVVQARAGMQIHSGAHRHQHPAAIRRQIRGLAIAGISSLRCRRAKLSRSFRPRAGPASR